jgi:hypothetical protein
MTELMVRLSQGHGGLMYSMTNILELKGGVCANPAFVQLSTILNIILHKDPTKIG